VPKSNWYDGWQTSDWHFINESVESAIKSGHFNKDLRYMSGVTTQEAAYILCKILNYLFVYKLLLFNNYVLMNFINYYTFSFDR